MRPMGLIGFVLALALAAPGVTAAPREPIRVQLLSFYAPVEDEGTRAGYASVTVYLEVADQDQASALCKQTPRLRAAITEVLNAHPARLRNKKKVDFTGLDGPVRDAANRALDRPMVRAAYLVEGVQSMGTGILSKFPASSLIGCKTVKQ